MRRFLRDPLLHFAIAGAALFVLHAWNGAPPDALDPVRIGAGELRWLEQTWTRQWQRPPSADEMRGLVRDLVREELLSRQAREMGLDQDDTIIRRRLAQKLEFLVQDTTTLQGEPSEELLRGYYSNHRARFIEPARVSFEQILFSNARRTDATADARLALAKIAASQAAAGDLGDASLLPEAIEHADRREIESQFGAEFAGAVIDAPAGTWQGPLPSAFGVHLLRVTGRSEAVQRSFENARTEVLAAWRDDEQRRIDAGFFQALLQRYEIIADDEAASLVAGLDGEALLTPAVSSSEAAR